MDKCQPQFLFQKTGMFVGVIEFFAFQHYFAADRLGLHHLYRGGRLWHHDRHRDAQPGTMIAEALRMIARRCCDHTAFARFFRQLEQRVQRATLLIGCGELQVFKL